MFFRENSGNEIGTTEGATLLWTSGIVSRDFHKNSNKLLTQIKPPGGEWLTAHIAEGHGSRLRIHCEGSVFVFQSYPDGGYAELTSTGLVSLSVKSSEQIKRMIAQCQNMKKNRR